MIYHFKTILSIKFNDIIFFYVYILKKLFYNKQRCIIVKLIVRVELNFKVEFEIRLLTKLDKNLYDNFIRLLTKKYQEIESNSNLKFEIRKSRILRSI